MSLEYVCGVPNFFSFFLMYINASRMILRYLDTLDALHIQIRNDKIVILTNSFCTVKPYVLNLEMEKPLRVFAKTRSVLVVPHTYRNGSSLLLKTS